MVSWLVLIATTAAADPATLSFEPTGCDGWSRAGDVLGGGNISDAVVLPDGRVFLVGSDPKSPQIFDPRTREVAPVAEGPWRFLANGQAVVLDDDELLLVGGQYVEPMPTGKRAESEPRCFALSLSADKWTPTECPSLWRAHVETHPRVIRLAGGRVIAFDGVDGVAELHASTREWIREARAPRVLAGNSIIGLDDHRVFAVGGLDSPAAYIYDADAQAWTAATAPRFPPFGSELVLLSDGRVLVGTEAIYDPSSDAWTPAPRTTATRSQPGLAALPDGSVLVAGGWDGNMRRVPFAEILRPGASAWEFAGANCVASRFPVLVDTVAGPFLFGGLEADGARESSTGSKFDFSFMMRNTVRIEHWDLTVADLPLTRPLPPRTLAPLEPGAASRPARTWVGERFPDLKFDVAGDRRRLSSWTGVRVVEVWATWCAPCRDALPIVDDVARRWGPKGVSTLLLSVDDDVERMRAFDSGIHYATLVWSRDASGELALGGIPATFVLDADGRVVAQHSGGGTLEAWLDEELARATQ